MAGVTEKIRDAGQRIAREGLDLPPWLMTVGVGAWLAIGIVAAAAIVAWFFAYSASISIPLLLAIVIGMIAYPLCERMTNRGLPKAAAAVLVLLVLVGVIVAVVVITVRGVISQWPSIKEQIDNAAATIGTQLAVWGFDTAAIESGIQQWVKAAESGDATSAITGGALSSVGTALATSLSSVFSLAFGLFIAATLLYYVLTDFPTISDWISSHMFGLPRAVSDGIIEDAVAAMRGYFRGTTLSGFIVAVLIGISMLLLGVPLAGTVAIVTFFTCYIPFFGAIVSGAFAFVVALGSNGLPTAVTLLVVILIAQNVLQTVINARIMGDSLNLHPLVVLVVTMLGGIFGGLLGAALAAPLAALLVNAGKRLTAALMPGEHQDRPDVIDLSASAEQTG